MADSILTPQGVHQTSSQYHLPEEHRQALLRQAPAFRRHEIVEKKRQQFIRKFGSDGTTNQA